MRHHTNVVTAIILEPSARQAKATDWALTYITLQIMMIITVTSFYKSHVSLLNIHVHPLGVLSYKGILISSFNLFRFGALIN